MVHGFVEDLDNVPVGCRIHDLKDIRTRWQGLGAHTWNFDWRAECHSSFPVPLVCLQPGRKRHGHEGQTKDYRHHFEATHFQTPLWGVLFCPVVNRIGSTYEMNL